MVGGRPAGDPGRQCCGWPIPIRRAAARDCDQVPASCDAGRDGRRRRQPMISRYMNLNVTATSCWYGPEEGTGNGSTCSPAKATTTVITGLWRDRLRDQRPRPKRRFVRLSRYGKQRWSARNPQARKPAESARLKVADVMARLVSIGESPSSSGDLRPTTDIAGPGSGGHDRTHAGRRLGPLRFPAPGRGRRRPCQAERCARRAPTRRRSVVRGIHRRARRAAVLAAIRARTSRGRSPRVRRTRPRSAAPTSLRMVIGPGWHWRLLPGRALRVRAATALLGTTGRTVVYRYPIFAAIRSCVARCARCAQAGFPMP